MTTRATNDFTRQGSKAPRVRIRRGELYAFDLPKDREAGASARRAVHLVACFTAGVDCRPAPLSAELEAIRAG